MTSVTLVKWDVGKCMIPQHPVTRSPHGSWDKSKNAYPLGNHIISNEATISASTTTGAPRVTVLAIMQFLNAYMFLLYGLKYISLVGFHQPSIDIDHSIVPLLDIQEAWGMW